MVTYSDLIQTGILIVGIIALFIQANKKKKPPGSQPCGYFCNPVGEPTVCRWHPRSMFSIIQSR
mgnify:CR=1 FL=1